MFYVIHDVDRSRHYVISSPVSRQHQVTMGIFWTQKDFFRAVANGDEKAVEKYLSHEKTRESWTVLTDKTSKETALHIAARHGHARIARKILDASTGKATYAIDGNGRHPLHLAAEGGHIEIVKMLLEAGSDRFLNTFDKIKMTPVHYAIFHGHTDILKTFLEKKVDLNAGNKPPLYFAVESKKLECVNILLDAGADPNVPRTETSVDYDDDRSYYSRTSRRTKTTKYSALNCACTQTDTAIASRLLEAGAKTQPDEYPLHVAAAHGNIPLATELIRHGFDAKATNAAKQTLLHVLLNTAESNPIDMVEFLLAQGVDKSAVDATGRTAFSYAQQYAQTEAVRILQGPISVLAPRPVVMPLPKLAPAPALPAAIPPPAPAPVVVDDETWMLAGKAGVVHATIFPPLSRRLTEIFNFETRERVTITENLALKTETMGPHESFDTISDAALKIAYGEFCRLGGNADEEKVFGSRLVRMKLK